MTAVSPEDDGSDIKNHNTLIQRDTIVTLNKIGLWGVCVFAPASYLTTAIWYHRCDMVDFGWGGFGLHVYLMASAWLLFGPTAAVSYRVMRDGFGASTSATRMVHAFLQALSCAFAIVAVRSIWIAHEDSGIAFYETGSFYTWHFKSSHSIIGIFTLSVYLAHLLTSFYVFFFASKAFQFSYRQLHMAIGQGLTLCMVFISATGMLYFESEAYNEDWDDWGSAGYWRPYMTVSQYCMIFLMFSIVLLFYSKVLIN